MGRERTLAFLVAFSGVGASGFGNSRLLALPEGPPKSSWRELRVRPWWFHRIDSTMHDQSDAPCIDRLYICVRCPLAKTEMAPLASRCKPRRNEPGGAYRGQW